MWGLSFVLCRAAEAHSVRRLHPYAAAAREPHRSQNASAATALLHLLLGPTIRQVKPSQLRVPLATAHNDVMST
jgi:hypothetical protein